MNVFRLSLLIFSCIRLCSQELIVTAIEYPPYTSEYMEGYGMSIEILSEALKHTDYIVTPVFYPTGRAFTELKKGNCHINLYNTPAVFDLGIYKRVDTIAVLYTFYYNKDLNDVAWNKLSDLKGLRLGSIRVTNVEGIRDELEEAGIIPVQTDSLVQIFTMLKKGRIDIALSVDLTAKSIIDKLYPGDKSIIQTQRKYMIINGGPWFNISTSIGNNAMKEYIKGKERMLNDGTLLRIMEKYYGKGKVPPEVIIK